MMSWPVSSLVKQRKVGSSSAKRCKPSDIFSRSAFVFGSMAIEITGSGDVDGFIVGSRNVANSRRHIHRRGQVIDDRVHQRLDTFFLECGTAEHRDQFDLASQPANGCFERLWSNRFLFDDQFGNLIVFV